MAERRSFKPTAAGSSPATGTQGSGPSSSGRTSLFQSEDSGSIPLGLTVLYGRGVIGNVPVLGVGVAGSSPAARSFRLRSVAEWLIALVLKSRVFNKIPWVRIPPDSVFSAKRVV